jgi:Protein of unknown function (DUF2846)
MQTLKSEWGSSQTYPSHRMAGFVKGPKMKRRILGLVLVAVISGCAAPQPRIEWQDVERGIPSGHGLVYFVRPSSVLAGLQTYEVKVNGERISQVDTGHYFTYLAAPGKLSLSAQTSLTAASLLAAPTLIGSAKLELDVQSGEISFVEIGVAFFGGPTLERIEADKGKVLVNKAVEQTRAP